MSLSRRRFALSAPLAVAAVGSMTWAGRARAAGQVFTVPFLMPRDKPYILIGINGKGPYRFTLDTGAAGKMGIDAHLAHELQLPDYDSEQHVGVVGEARESGLYAGDVVNFGGAFTQRHVALAGIGDGRLKRIGTVGLIPAPFFLNRPCELDFERTELRIYAEGEPDRTGFSPLPFIAQNRDQIFVDAKFNGVPCRLQVDTGAEGGLVLQPRFVRRNRLWDAFPRHLDSGVRGITGGAKSREVKGDALEFGGFRFRNPVATLIDPDATSELDEDGLIGIDILRRFTLSFDGADHRMAEAQPLHRRALLVRPSGRIGVVLPRPKGRLRREGRGGRVRRQGRAGGGRPVAGRPIDPTGFGPAVAAELSPDRRRDRTQDRAGRPAAPGEDRGRGSALTRHAFRIHCRKTAMDRGTALGQA